MNNENIYLKIIYCNISDYQEHHVCLLVMAVMILNHLYHASHCLFWTEWENPSYTTVKAKFFFIHCVHFTVTYILILLIKFIVGTRLQFLHRVKALHR